MRPTGTPNSGVAPTVKMYRVLYTNQKAGKKSRRFQDGFVKITNEKQLELTNSEHQNVFKGNSFKKRVEEDDNQLIFNIGIYEIQVEEEITVNEFKGTTPAEGGSGVQSFHQSSSSVPLLAGETPSSFWDLSKAASPTSTGSSSLPSSQGSKSAFQAPAKFKAPNSVPSTTSTSKVVEETPDPFAAALAQQQVVKKASPKKIAPAKPFADPFKPPASTTPNHLAEALKSSGLGIRSPVKTAPYTQETVELPSDLSKVHLICSKGDFDGKIEHNIFVEHFLFKEMMPHQLEGVDFMFQCITGLKNDKMKGCILADMSGLGKTLQVIALMWTLLKQNPFSREPFLKKVIIACPLLSVKSWKNEIAHWLGEKNLYPVVIEKVDPTASSQVKKFLKDSFRCLIVPYEVIQKENKLFSEEVTADLLVCDDGHKLKSPNSSLYKTMKNINCQRRILMTSTPIQKDLTDLYASIRFVNPTLFKKENYFADFFIVPITKGMAIGARPEEREIAKIKTKSLLDIIALFMIRRTVSVVESLLPQKFEFQVMIKPTDYQVELYDKCLESFRSDLGEPINEALIPYKTLNSVLSVLKKILFHPKEIIESGDNSWEPVEAMKQDIYLKLFQKPLTLHSNKIVFIERVLEATKASGEKLIIATHHPMTVNVLADLLTKKKVNFHRVDSTGAAQKRQGLISSFNAPYSGVNVLILHLKVISTVPSMSAASRIIIVDMDRTSCGEQQLTSKVYTKGLTRPLHIYRLISGGTIEERMLEKQILRDDIAAFVLDEKEGPEYEFQPGDAKSFIGYYDERISPRNQRRKNYKELMIDEILGASQENALLQSSVQTISAITPTFKEIVQFVGIEEERIRNAQELQIFSGQEELLTEPKTNDRDERISESKFKDHEERLEKLIEGGRNPDDPPSFRNSRKLASESREEPEIRDAHGDEVLEAVFGKQAVNDSKPFDEGANAVDDNVDRDQLWLELEAGMPKEAEPEAKSGNTNMLLEALRSSGLGVELGNDFFKDLGLEGSNDRGQADKDVNQTLTSEGADCQNHSSEADTNPNSTGFQNSGMNLDEEGAHDAQAVGTSEIVDESGQNEATTDGDQVNWMGSSDAAAMVFEKLKDFGIDFGEAAVETDAPTADDSVAVTLAEHESAHPGVEGDYQPEKVAAVPEPQQPIVDDNATPDDGGSQLRFIQEEPAIPQPIETEPEPVIQNEEIPAQATEALSTMQAEPEAAEEPANPTQEADPFALDGSPHQTDGENTDTPQKQAPQSVNQQTQDAETVDTAGVPVAQTGDDEPAPTATVAAAT